jgi:hypothetical protein
MSAKYQIKSAEGNGFWFASSAGDLCWTDATLACTFQSKDEAQNFADGDMGPIGSFEVVEIEGEL